MPKNIKNHRFLLILTFVLMFFTGLYISEDYGVSWDEPLQRNGALSTFKYVAENFGITHPSFEHIIDIDKNVNAYVSPYAIIFDFPAIIWEELFGLNDKRDIFLFRHKLTFVFHFIGILAFFLFAREILNSNIIAIIACLVYSLHPRIFAHGFFNPKDIIFLSMVSMSMYSSLKFIKMDSNRWMFISSIFLGLAMSVRIVGIYLPFLVLMFYWICHIEKKSSINITKIKYLIIRSVIVIFISLAVLIIVTPYFWSDPISLFFNNIILEKHHSNNVTSLFIGENISAFSTPWYYIIVWFLITTPLTLLLFFIFGLLSLFYNSFNNYNKIKHHLFCLFGLAIPLFTAIILESVLYDGWRHFYFSYCFIAVIISFGIAQLLDIVKKKLDLNQISLAIIFSIIIFIEPIFSIYQMHPHQSAYFNIFAGKDPMMKFDGDYWGTCYIKGLEWIVENDNRDSIMVLVQNFPGKENRYLIKHKDRKRLHFKIWKNSNEISGRTGDYYITNFREQQPLLYQKAKRREYPFNNEIFSVNARGMKLLGVYRLE